MTFTGVGTPGGVRRKTSTLPAPPPLAQANYGASPDDRARLQAGRPGLPPLFGPAEDDQTPSATIAHSAFLTYLGSVKRYERAGFTAVTRRQRSFPLRATGQSAQAALADRA